MRAKVWGRFRTFHENKLYQIVQLVHINNSPKSLKQCSVRSPTKFISAGITKRSSNAPNLPDAHSFCRCAIQCGICRSQQINVTLHDERGKLSTSQIRHPKKNRPFPVKYTADPTLLRLAGNQELIRPVNRNLQFWNMRHA